MLCRVLLLKCETRRILIHTFQIPLDHESTLAIMEARTLVILQLAGLQLELILAACSITHLQIDRASYDRDASDSYCWSTYIWNISIYVCIYVHICM